MKRLVALLWLLLPAVVHAQAPQCTAVAPSSIACQSVGLTPQLSDILLGQQGTGPLRPNQTVQWPMSALFAPTAPAVAALLAAPPAIGGTTAAPGNFSSLSVNGVPVSPPGGATTWVQFNCAGLLCGDSTFTFNSSTKAVTIGGLIQTGGPTLGGTQNNATIAYNATGSTNLANQKISSVFNMDATNGDSDTTIAQAGVVNFVGSFIGQTPIHHAQPLVYLLQKQTGGNVRGVSLLAGFANLTQQPTAVQAWAPNTVYTAYLSAVQIVNSTGVIQVYQATVGGTSGSTFPSVCTATCVDGTVTWSNSGPLFGLDLAVGFTIYAEQNQNMNGTPAGGIGQLWGGVSGFSVGASGTYGSVDIAHEFDLSISPMGAAAPSAVYGVNIDSIGSGQGKQSDYALSFLGAPYNTNTSTFTGTAAGTTMTATGVTGLLKIGETFVVSAVTYQIVSNNPSTYAACGGNTSCREISPAGTFTNQSITTTAYHGFASRRNGIHFGTDLDPNSGVAMMVGDVRGYSQFGAGMLDFSQTYLFAGTQSQFGNDAPFILKSKNIFLDTSGNLRIGPATITPTVNGITIDAAGYQLPASGGVTSISGGTGIGNQSNFCDTVGDCGVVTTSGGVPTAITLWYRPYMPAANIPGGVGTPPANIVVTGMVWHQIDIGNTGNILGPTDQITFGSTFTTTNTYQQCGGAACGLTIGGNAVTNVLNPGQSALRVHLSTPQTVTSATNTQVAYDTVDWDTRSYWVNGSGTTCSGGGGNCYNPKVAGKYRVCVHNILIGTSGTNAGIQQTKIYKNGSVDLAASTANVGAGAFIMTPDTCDDAIMNGSTDYLEGWAVVNSPGTATVGGGSAGAESVMTIDFVQP